MSEITTNNNEQRFEIEASEYRTFRQLYDGGTYKYLRYGQAFYNHFGMQKMTSHKDLMNKLYYLDDEAAREFIEQHFDIR